MSIVKHQITDYTRGWPGRLMQTLHQQSATPAD